MSNHIVVVIGRDGVKSHRLKGDCMCAFKKLHILSEKYKQFEQIKPLTLRQNSTIKRNRANIDQSLNPFKGRLLLN